MKTFPTLLALVSALAVPGAFAAEFAGLSLPTVIDPMQAFLGLVMSLVVMIAFGDYAKPARRLAGRTALKTAASGKSAHPLAA